MNRPLLLRKRFWTLIALGAGSIALFVYRQEVTAFLTHLDWQEIHEAVRASGPWAPVLCILLDAVFTVLSLPTTLVGIAIALLFGVGKGLIIALLGLGLGMSTSFLIARYLIRDWLGRCLSTSRFYQRLNQMMTTNGWRLVMFTRLLPINPYSLLTLPARLHHRRDPQHTRAVMDRPRRRPTRHRPPRRPRHRLTLRRCRPLRPTRLAPPPPPQKNPTIPHPLTPV